MSLFKKSPSKYERQRELHLLEIQRRADAVAKQAEESRKLIEKMRQRAAGVKTVPSVSLMKQEKELEYRFQTEPIVGYRVWGRGTYTLASGVHETRIASVGMFGSWQGYQRLDARCMRLHHDAPHTQCHCGVWAVKDEDVLVEAAGAYGSLVWGTVYMWGRVLQTEKGWRAQYAYPKELHVYEGDEAMVKELEQTYGVPVTVKDLPGSPLNNPALAASSYVGTLMPVGQTITPSLSQWYSPSYTITGSGSSNTSVTLRTPGSYFKGGG